MPAFWNLLASLQGPAGPIGPRVVELLDPQVGDRRIVLHTDQVLTLTSVAVVLWGGSSPSVAFSLRHGSDVSQPGTSVSVAPLSTDSTTAGTVVTTFTDGVVPAGAWLWLAVSEVSGSPAALTVSIAFS